MSIGLSANPAMPAKETLATLAGLRTITFRLLRNCNLRCIMCDHPLQPTRLMPLETVTNTLDQLTSPVRVTYIGGEPCLWLARYPHILPRTLRDGHAVHLISNALLFHKIPGLIDSFRDQRISVQISIDGYGETYEGIRKRASWDRLVSNVRAIANARMDGMNVNSSISVNYLLMRRTLADLPRFIEFCAAESIDAVLLTYTMIYDRMVRLGEIAEDESVYHCQEETNDAVARACEVARREGISLCIPAPLGHPERLEAHDDARMQRQMGVRWIGPRVLAAGPPGQSHAAIPDGPACTKPWTDLWIYEDGAIVPCCCGVSTGPKVGTSADGLASVWNGARIGEIRKGLAGGEFPPDCRCGINISAVGRQEGEEHFFSRERDRKLKMIGMQA